MILFYHHKRNMKELRLYLKEELDKLEIMLYTKKDEEDEALVNSLIDSLNETRKFFDLSLKFLENKIKKEPETGIYGLLKSVWNTPKDDD